MKKFLLTTMICLSAFLCTGCVKVSYNIEIDKNDKVKLAATQAYNLEMLKSMDSNIEQKFQESIEEPKKEFESKGYKVEEYLDETYSGLTIYKENLDFASAAKDLPDGLKKKNENAFTIEKGLFKDKYKIHFICKLDDIMSGTRNSDTAETDMSGSDSDELEEGVVSVTKTTDPVTGKITERREYEGGGYSEVTYDPKEVQQFGNAIGTAVGTAVNTVPGMTPVADMTIKIPYAATKNNADKVISPTEYQWNLVKENGSDTEIILEYEKSKIGTIFFFGIAGIGLIILLMIIVSGTKNKGKRPKRSGTISGF